MKKILLKSILIGLLAIAFQTSAHAAQLRLSPSSANLQQGCENVVDIVVNTEGESTRGADAFLSYNPNEIEMLDIRPGGVYKSYPGKIFGNGNIRITAFSENGLFSGSGTLAQLVFRSKPGIESTTINFNYSPGATTDSNVAAEGANDILSSVYGGSYTFEPGDSTCIAKEEIPEAVKPPSISPVPDTKPPWLENLRPGADWENMVPNTNLTFTILDDQSGVNLDSLFIKIDGVLYTKSGENIFSYEGDPKRYEITIDPARDFTKEKSELIPVSVRAQDMDRNSLSLDYNFTVYPVQKCDECEVFRPAAPEISRGLLLIWLILLALSLLLNIDLLINEDNAIIRKTPFFKHLKRIKPHFTKKRIRKK